MERIWSRFSYTVKPIKLLNCGIGRRLFQAKIMILKLCFGWLIKLCFDWLIKLCFGWLIKLCIGWLMKPCFGWLMELCFGWFMKLCFDWLMKLRFWLVNDIDPILKIDA